MIIFRSFVLGEPFYLSHAGGIWLAGAGGWLSNDVLWICEFEIQSEHVSKPDYQTDFISNFFNTSL